MNSCDDHDMLKLLADLVRCPTENRPPHGYEAEGMKRIEEAYRQLGLQVSRVCPRDLPQYPDHPAFLPRDFEDRENVVGIWRGSGGGKSVLLTGHMDVAPKEPMPWTVTQPYVPLIRDGRMYGRGTADMKAGLACAWEAVRRLQREGFEPSGDILLESVVDEEYAGANGTIAGRLAGYNADFAIVLEPTGMNVCPACVGGLVIQLHVKGIAGMPYTGEEISNPAYDIAELIALVKRFSEKRIAETPQPALWADTVQGAQVVITKVKAGEVGYEGQLSTPIDAWMEIVMQSYPGEEEEELLSALKRFLRENYRDPDGVTMKRMYRYCRPAHTDPEHPAVKLLSECGMRYTKRARICGAMFSCDMFALTELGHIPSVIFGPIGGRLHAPDEWVDLESMELCVRTLMDFIRRWCA
ncbi:MAG: M20 family metallopeptidase [Candidatus Excrementavichristensenella sp.]|jgi:acetylornithine deacetylase